MRAGPYAELQPDDPVLDTQVADAILREILDRPGHDVLVLVDSEQISWSTASRSSGRRISTSSPTSREVAVRLVAARDPRVLRVVRLLPHRQTGPPHPLVSVDMSSGFDPTLQLGARQRGASTGTSAAQ